MHTWTRANRLGIVAATAGLLILWACAPRADEPKGKRPDPARPPWQRLLTGEDARQAKELQGRIDALYAKAAFAEAVEPAGQLWRLWQRMQGPTTGRPPTPNGRCIPCGRWPASRASSAGMAGSPEAGALGALRMLDTGALGFYTATFQAGRHSNRTTLAASVKRSAKDGQNP
jgi:hypothetical protein